MFMAQDTQQGSLVTLSFAPIPTCHFVITISLVRERSLCLAVVVGLWSPRSMRLEKGVVIGIVVE